MKLLIQPVNWFKEDITDVQESKKLLIHCPSIKIGISKVMRQLKRRLNTFNHFQGHIRHKTKYHNRHFH